MSRKLVLLNILLAGLLVWLGVQLRTHWLESTAREQAALGRAAKSPAVIAPAAVPALEPASSADYIDVAQRMLFSKDRDPNVLLEPPPPPAAPPPEKPVPPLPTYFGQMALGEPVIVLSADRAAQKSYHVGERVGEFKVAAFDRDTVTLEWNEKVLVTALRDLAPKEGERPAQAAAPTAAPAESPAKTITKMGDGPPKAEPLFGPLNGSFPTCLPEDKSPDGTTKDGFRKKISMGMMGASCMWEPINK